MAWIDKEELRLAQEGAQRYEELTDLAGISDQDTLLAYMGVAREIFIEMRVLEQSDDPKVRSDAFEMACDSVRERRLGEVMSYHATEVEHTEEATVFDALLAQIRANETDETRSALRDRIKKEKGPKLEEQARAKVAADEFPDVELAVAAEIEAEVAGRRDAIRAELAAGYKESPKAAKLRATTERKVSDAMEPEVQAEVDAEIVAEVQARAPEIKAELRASVEKGDKAESRRRAAINDVRALATEELLAEIYQGRLDELRHDRAAREIAAAEFSERIADITDTAKRSLCIPFDKFRPQDVLIVSFADKPNTGALRRTDSRGYPSTSNETSRTLRLRVLDPASGSMIIMDDSWQTTGKAVEAANALPDSALVKLATIISDGGNKPMLRREFSRGMALGILYGKKPRTVKGMEVASVKLLGNDEEHELFVD